MNVNYDRVAVIATLCAVVIGGMATICFIAVHQRAIDPLLAALVTGTIGLLIPSPLRHSTQIDQPPGDPVPVTTDVVPVVTDAGHANPMNILIVLAIAILVICLFIWLGIGHP